MRNDPTCELEMRLFEIIRMKVEIALAAIFDAYAPVSGYSVDVFIRRVVWFARKMWHL